MGVDSHQHRSRVRAVLILCGRGEHDVPRSRHEVSARLLVALEAARRLDDHVDIEFAPWQPFGLAFLEKPYWTIADDQRGRIGRLERDRTIVAPVRGVEP